MVIGYFFNDLEFSKWIFQKDGAKSLQTQKSSINEKKVTPSEVQKIRIIENINLCLDSANPELENLINTKLNSLEKMEIKLKKLKAEIFSYSSLLSREEKVTKEWNIVNDSSYANDLITLSFNLNDTKFLCEYDNESQSPNLIRVSRNNQIVFDAREVEKLKEIADEIKEKKIIEQKEYIDLKKKLDDEANSYRKALWRVQKYSNVEYKSYLKHHEKTEFKSQSPSLKVTCMPSGPSIYFENSSIYNQNAYPIYFMKKGVSSKYHFNISGFESEVGGYASPKELSKFISLMKDAETITFNNSTFKIENLGQVPCL